MKQNNKFRNILLVALMLLSISLFAQDQTVTGIVTDSDGQLLPGASVVIKGTSTGTQTDFHGNYSIKANSGDTLVFSYIGFEAQEIVLTNQTTVNVTLVAGNTLDEVVVVGYGTQKKSSLTASVSVLDPKETKKLATYDATTALQGRATGVYVETNGGVAGANANIVIRGTGTLTDATPLYVIDGAFADNISFLNPEDIASIQVLKDASASAIYGSRAANGVVLVTTNRGIPGKTK